MKKWFIIISSLIFMMSVISLAFVSSLQVGNPEDNTGEAVYLFQNSIVPSQFNASFNASILSNYWDLAGNNAPPTGNWNMGTKSLLFGDTLTYIKQNNIGFDRGIDISAGIEGVSRIGIILLGEYISVGQDGIKFFHVNGGFDSPGFLKNDGSNIISGGNSIDISADTNLFASSPITLTGDTIGFDFSTNNTWTGTNTFNDDVYLDPTKYFIGNGSKLTDLCLSNGTNCQSGSVFDNTNIAYLNNSQTFTGRNNFSDNVRMNGANLTVKGRINAGLGNLVGVANSSFHLDLTTSSAQLPANFNPTIIQLAMSRMNGNVGMGLLSCNTCTVTLTFGDTENFQSGRILYKQATNIFKFLSGSGVYNWSAGNAQDVVFNFDSGDHSGNMTFYEDEGFFKFSDNVNVSKGKDICITGGNCLSKAMTTQHPIRSIIKGIDNTIKGTAYINDTNLSLHVTAGKNYTFEIYLHLQDGTANDDAWVNISRPAGDLKVFNEYNDAISFNMNVCDDYDLNNMGEIGNDCDNIPYQTAGGNYPIHLSGTFFPTASGGFTLQYRENTDVGGDYSVNKGSSLVLTEVT